jgi:two-component system chemotaxis response regulator CheY
MREDLSVEDRDSSVESAPKRHHVLVADDSPDVLNLMRRVLESKGYVTDSASTGEICLEKFLNGDFQLLVLDFMMPGLNGVDVVKEIRKYRSPEEFPIIMITAKQSRELVNLALKSGVNDFIIKPLRSSDFSRRIEKNLVWVGDEDVPKILSSLSYSDSSAFNSEIRKNLTNQNLISYPFKIGDTKGYAILKSGHNIQALAKLPIASLVEEVVLIAKGGILWNTIWPRQVKTSFLETKNSFNSYEDLFELLK